MGAEGCLFRAAGSAATTLGHRIGRQRLSFFRHTSCCPRRVVFKGGGIFQQQFLAVEGTDGRRPLARVTAFAVAVMRASWLLAGLLPVTDDGRESGQVLAEEGGRVIQGHRIPPCEGVLQGGLSNGFRPNKNRPGDSRSISPGTPLCVFVAGCAEQSLFLHHPSAVNAGKKRPPRRERRVGPQLVGID